MLKFSPYLILVCTALLLVCTPATAAPYVDVYGQKVSASWPGKVHADTDLASGTADEARHTATWENNADEFDSYGGWLKAGWHLPGSGFFTTARHNGVWWLITPAGNPCFYTGLDTAPSLTWEDTPVTGREGIFTDLPAHDGPFADAWAGDPWGGDPGISSFCFGASNLIRKYGPGWKDKFRIVTVRRLKAWGFSGLGKWGDIQPGVPCFPVLVRTGVPVLAGHPDPFDPSVQSKLQAVLAPQITPYKDDPEIAAWSVGNETAEIISQQEIGDILDDGADVPAKRALMDYALATLYHGDEPALTAAWSLALPDSSPDALHAAMPQYIPAADIEALRRYYAGTYYALMEKTVKALDPNHLYAGFWIVPFSDDQADWTLEANNSDIVGFDDYTPAFPQPWLAHWITKTNRPILCGEFSFPQSDTDRGFSSFGTVATHTEARSGAEYNRYARSAAENPSCVGISWFQYRDEPVTGRGPGHGPGTIYGENYAFGLVDIADQPKWPLVDMVRLTNLHLAELRSHL